MLCILISSKGCNGTLTKFQLFHLAICIQILAPVEESPTIYQAFIEEEQRKEKRLMESEKENQSKTSNSLAGMKKNSSSAGTKKREKVPPLEEALDNVRESLK